MKINNILIIILFSIALISCEKIIDINIDEKDKKIVVNSIISTDSIVKVNLSKSLNILDNKNAIFLNNAIVNLYENNVFIQKLTYTENGNYLANNFYPVVNKTYKIEVKSEGLHDVSAQNIIPNKVNINSIDTLYKNNEKFSGIEFTINFTDPANQENYYLLQTKALVPSDWDYYGNPTNFTQQSLAFQSDDNIVETNLSYGEGGVGGEGIVFSDNLINGQTYPLKINIGFWNFYSDTNKVYIYLSSISKEFYMYLKSYNANIENRNNPFAEPVQVFENVNDGYGIFAGYSSFVDSMLVIGSGEPKY